MALPLITAILAWCVFIVVTKTNTVPWAIVSLYWGSVTIYWLLKVFGK